MKKTDNDTIIAGPNAYIDGGAGNDFIDAGGGSGSEDVFGLGIYGGAGNDTLIGGAANDAPYKRAA